MNGDHIHNGYIEFSRNIIVNRTRIKFYYMIKIIIIIINYSYFYKTIFSTFFIQLLIFDALFIISFKDICKLVL